MSMKVFLDRLHKKLDDEVLYLQSQNDNLHDELQVLLQDATADIPFATETFGAKPDVANVWIGDDRSITSVHKGKVHVQACGTDKDDKAAKTACPYSQIRTKIFISWFTVQRHSIFYHLPNFTAYTVGMHRHSFFYSSNN